MSSYLSPVIQHNDQRIFVKGSIKEKEIDFLLDTGAEITVIPTKLAQGLNIIVDLGLKTMPRLLSLSMICWKAMVKIQILFVWKNFISKLLMIWREHYVKHQH